jgi:TetR/AcrR family transcriptional repressor of nem operon
MQHVDEKAAAVEKLKQLIANFVERRPPLEGGCPILNTAVEADDGNLVLRERVSKALRSWLRRLEAILKEAVKSGEARAGVDPKTVATLIVASLEGALMMSRIERNRVPSGACRIILTATSTLKSLRAVIAADQGSRSWTASILLGSFRVV